MIALINGVPAHPGREEENQKKGEGGEEVEETAS